MEKKESLGKWIILGILIIISLVGISVFAVVLFKPSKRKVQTISESNLRGALEISELSTVEYTYNAVARAYDEDSKTLMYSVAYDGIVKAGIDFSKIGIDIDEEEKLIHITVPEVEILDYIVDEGSLEYIFEKEKYNTATVPQAAYKICKAHLERKASRETELLSLAWENAKSTVSGLIEPWVKQIDDTYTVVVERGDGDENEND